MVTDRQVRTLMKLVTEGKSIVHAAAKSDMDPKTARKYIGLHMLPSEHKSDHTWRTCIDPFAAVWPDIATGWVAQMVCAAIYKMLDICDLLWVN